MAIESVAIGAHVWARGGEPLGRVARFVVAPATRQLAALVVDHGPLSTERVVDVALVDRSAHDEVFLTVGDDEAGRLPPFATREVARGREPALPPERRVTFDPVAGFARYPDEGAGVAELRCEPLFETPPPETVVETISSVPENSIVLSKHTRVVSADGFTAGHVHGLELDERQRVVGFVMTAGHLHQHHVRLPVSSVAELRHDRIVLTQGLDEVTDALDEADVRPA